MALHLEYMYQCLGPMVFRRCLALTGNGDDAIKAALETFTQVMNHEFWLLDTTPSRLLLVISTRESLRLIASRKSATDSRLSDIATLSAERDLNRNRTADLFFPPKALTPGVVAVLIYIDEFTIEEVANELGLSLGKTKSLLKPFAARLGQATTKMKSSPPDWILEQYAAGEMDDETAKPLHAKLDQDPAFAARVDKLKTDNAVYLETHPVGPFMGEVYGKALSAPRTLEDYKKFSRYILPALVLITAFILIVTLGVTFSQIRRVIMSELPTSPPATVTAPATPSPAEEQPGIPVKLAPPTVPQKP